METSYKKHANMRMPRTAFSSEEAPREKEAARIKLTPCVNCAKK